MKNFRRLLEMSGLLHRSDPSEKENLLLEQDDLFGGDEDEDEEGGDEEGEEGEDEGDDEGDEEEEEEEAEEPEKLTNQEIAEFGPGEIDKELDQVFNQIFIDSQSAAKVKSQESMGYPGENQEIEESLKRRSLKILLEQEEGEVPEEAHIDNFDIGTFCAEVARYINNYQTLIDMEGMIFNKAKQFLLNQFGEGIIADFEETMALNHDVDLSGEFEEELVAPVAAGAGGEGGGGGV